MHDPMTLIYGCRWFDLWHVDPGKDGTDDSCGWFIRGRHGDKSLIDRIARRFEFEWTHGVPFGWFSENGEPNFSTHAIVLGMFRIAVNEMFGHWSRRADRFLRRHLFDILHFAENNCDSLFDFIQQSYGREEKTPKERAKHAALIVYPWILRADRSWWRHPRWHVHHWKLIIHPAQKLKRWLFSRCARCGKRFRWGYAPCSYSWHSDGPRWFRGEPGVYHHECTHHESDGTVSQTSAVGQG